MREIRYYRSSEAEVFYRLVVDDETETFMGYFARPGLRAWTEQQTLFSEITMGDLLVENLDRAGALELLRGWGVTPDRFDSE